MKKKFKEVTDILFKIALIGGVIGLTIVIFVKITIDTPENLAAAELVKNSEEIRNQLGNIDVFGYKGFPKKTQTGGIITKFSIASYSDAKTRKGTRHEINVHIEKNNEGEWYIYSWEVILEEPYQG